MYRQLLSTLGIRKALAIFTAIDALAFLCGYAMLEERRPPEKRPPLVWFDRAFFADPVFWSLALCFFFTVLYVSSLFLSFSSPLSSVWLSTHSSLFPSTRLTIGLFFGDYVHRHSSRFSSS